MLINLRNALMAGKRLPYDAEVEYLQSSGTQYIPFYTMTGNETSVRFVINFACYLVETRVSYITIPNTKGPRIFGLANGSYTAYNLRMSCDPGGSVGAGSFSANGAWHTVDATFDSNGDITRIYDGTLATYSRTFIVVANGVFRMFGLTNEPFVGKISKFQLYIDGVLVRDLIPVRVGTVGYLYDRVSGKLFGNAGTGDFVLGPDVVPVEYIESHGTEWIDTGVKVADPSTISISVDSDGVTPFGVVHNNVVAGSWIGVDSRTSATEVAVYSKDFDSRKLFEFSAGRHTFKWDGATGFQIDGVSKSAFTATVGKDAIDSVSWPLFGRHDCYNNSINGRGRSKFYGANIEISGTPTRKYLPVRVGTEGAMMDVLTRRIYRNAGTGAFTYGNDLKYPIPSE